MRTLLKIDIRRDKIKNKKPSWKKLKTREIHKTKWIEILEDDVILPSGNESIYTYVKRKSGICLMLLEENFIYLVSQYRYPIHQEILQFTLESGEENELPKEIAKRCATGELGYKTDELIQIGSGYVDAGLNTQKLYYFVAKGKEIPETKQLEETELDLRVKKVKISELDQMIQTEKIVDFHTITGVYFLKEYFKRQ